MTREKKIESIIEGTTKALEEMTNNGIITPEIYATITKLMNETINSIQ